MEKYLRSLFNLCWKSIVQLTRIAVALIKRDFSVAADQARVLAIFIHDDLVQIVAALQKPFPFWRVVPNGRVDKILVVKLDRVGDMVNTTPVFDALRSVFPEAHLDVVGHPMSLSILQGDPRIAERFPYKSCLYHPLAISFPGLKAWRLVFRLLKRKYPVVIYLRGSFPFLLLGLTSRLAPAKFISGEPVITRYLRPIETLWGPVPKHDPSLHISDDDLLLARTLIFGSDNHKGPNIAIHAMAGAVTKIWPVERFATLADDLCRLHKAHVHFFGSPDDRPALESIARSSVHSHFFHWDLGLPQVTAVIATCDLFIGNDSGLSHIAAAVRTPLIVLWGPANLDMARPKAPPDRCVILYNHVPCRTVCPEFHCVNPVQLECLKKIEPAEAVEAARRLLRNRVPPKIGGERLQFASQRR